MITVKELKKQLKGLPDTMPIILQTDDEGNGYRYIRGIEGITEGDQRNFYKHGECIRADELLEYEEVENPEAEGYTLVAVIY